MADVVNAGVPEPAVVNLPIYRGDPVYAPFRLYTTTDGGVTKDYYDLTGYTINAQVRKHPDDTDVLLELTVTVPTQTGDDLGRFLLEAAETDTAGLPALVARWDVQLTDTGGVRRTWMRGAVPITGDVTREVGP